MIQPICRLVKETNIPGDVICEYQSQKKGDKNKEIYLGAPGKYLSKRNYLSEEVMTTKSGLNFFRKRLWTLLEPATEEDKASRITDIFLVSLIFFNILMVILETVENLYLNYKTFFNFNFFCNCFFNRIYWKVLVMC